LIREPQKLNPMKSTRLNSAMKAVTLAAMATVAPLVSMAQEAKSPLPWKNVVSAEDTMVFYVMAAFAVFLMVLIWAVASVTTKLTSDKELWKNKWNNSAKAVAVFVGLGLMSLAPVDVLAAGTKTPLFPMTDGLFWTMLFVNLFLVLVLFAMIYNLYVLIRTLRTTVEPEAESAPVVEKSFWEGSLSKAVPVAQEADIMLDHEYDGIRELDNQLPPWWLYMFYFTIIFGVVYIGYYQLSPGHTQQDEYAAEMALAEQQKAEFLANAANNVDENSVTVLTGAAIENGKATFTSLCVACHGPSGGSNPNGVGPNLTDEFWINGGGINNIFKTIKYGVPTKGMISWEAQLSPVQMQEVASYIVSLQGSNPENAKAPQGEIWSDVAVTDSLTTDTAALVLDTIK